MAPRGLHHFSGGMPLVSGSDLCDHIAGFEKMALKLGTGEAVVQTVTANGTPIDEFSLLAGLAVWSTGLGVLALIDASWQRVPTRLVRAVGAITVAALLIGGASSGNWSYLLKALLCTVVVTGVFYAWAARCPASLGRGDVRFAGLVALGAGAVDPPACMAALATGVLACAVASRFGLPGGPSAVALGPFLAIAGFACVVARAF